MYELNSLGERIEYVQRKVGGSLNLDKLAEVSQPQQSRLIRNAIANPGVKTIEAIAKAGGVSLTWLITGEGAPDEGGSGSGYIRVPVVDGTDAPDVMFERMFLKHALRVDPANAVLFFQDSDSMEPGIKHGATVLVDKTKKSGDGVFLLRVHDSYLLRRRDICLSERDNLKHPFSYFRSDNTVNEAEKDILIFQEAHLQEHQAHVELIGKVIWVGGPQ